MIDEALQIIAPHHCYSCGKTGFLLCNSCKYDIVLGFQNDCVVCFRASKNGVCARHKLPYQKAWVVGRREGSLQGLIDLYKFENARTGAKVLAGLLNETLPQFSDDTIVVPVTTIKAHIRQRGYDHMVLVAKDFARHRGLKMQKLLKRQTTTHQRGESAVQRELNAQDAFAATLLADVPYLILDDVMTTGATLKYAAKALKDAGARTIYVAALARQPLD